MAFLRANVGPESYVARGVKVGLRPLQVADYAPWAELRAQSREHLQPFEPRWPSDELLKSAYRRRLRHYQREQREDLGYAFAIFSLADDTLVGGVSLSNVRRGVTQAAQLGYWLGKPHLQQGYMSDAVAAVLPFTFFGLRLHRIEAATLPTNATSIRVLERNGFEREGYARRYLKINDEWQDHILFALLAEDFRGPHRVPSERRDGTGGQ
ncbi:MAG: GNAT family protein [Hyphomicrobiaceae bacterium]